MMHWGSRAALLLVSALSVGSVVSISVAAADESPREITIPAGPMQRALQRLTQSTQLELLYDSQLVRGLSTAGVTGVMTPRQALERLLAGTDIAPRFTSAHTVALYKEARAAPKPTPDASAQPAVPNPQPHTITISADRTGKAEYDPAASLSSLKLDGPPLLAAVAAQSVTGQVLRDQQATRLEDILENVSSIESAPDGQSAPGFAIRGFTTYQYYIDGVRVSPDLHHDGFRDLANVERIDVLKGPASTLYGRTEAGGLINIVTRQPLSQPYLSVQQQAGTFDFQRTQLDASGPLTVDRSLLYRFNAAYESADSFRELLQNRRLFLAPVVSWTRLDATAAAYVEYLRSDDPTDAGLPVIAGALPPVPIGRRVENGGSVHTRDLRVGFRGSYDIDHRWTVRYHFDTRWLQTPQSAQLALADNGLDPRACNRSQCPVDQQLFAIPVSNGLTRFISLELTGDTTLWGIHHAALAGAEYFNVRAHQELVFSNSGFVADLYQGRPGPVPTEVLQNPDGAFATTSGEHWGSAYLQDQMAFADSLYLFAGVRYDHVREFLDTASGFPLVSSGSDSRWDNAFKRRIGALWHPTTNFSLYANYLENFGISTGLYGDGTGGTGTLLPPESAREWEVGIKGRPFGGTGMLSLAWYDLTKVNIAQPIAGPLANAQGFRTVTGAARNQGLELDLQGEVLPGLTLTGSYAYVDSRITRDVGMGSDALGNPVVTPGNTGNRLYGVARHGGSLWATYRAGGSALHGLRLGVGVVARSSREGDNLNDYALPGFSRWNLLAAYARPLGGAQVELQFNIDNLFNRRYFESVSGAYSVLPGQPRRWLACVRVTF